MSRTNIEIDDDLIQEVMKRFRLRTKREAVDFALRKAMRRKLTKDEVLALEGIGWEGDLDEMRKTRYPDW